MLGYGGPPAGVLGTMAVAALWVVPLIGAGMGLLRPLVPGVQPASARVASR